MGLFSMLRKAKEEHETQVPIEGPRAGGFFRGTVNQDKREHKEQPTIHMSTQEILYVDDSDELFQANHAYLGTDSQGMPVYKRRKIAVDYDDD